MRYFLIAGEASGDLHAAHLIRSIRQIDAQAEFEGFGGDLMAAEGMRLLRHYRTLAFMGFVQVVLHLPTILRGMRECKRAIRQFRPDVVVLVDYPGFNLNIAQWVRHENIAPTAYYIAPKIWAWKEGRIRRIRRDIDRLFSILPFEVDYFQQKHHHPVTYVGNPTLDEITAFKANYAETQSEFAHRHQLAPHRPILALIPGSRRSEIAANLPRMLAAVKLTDPEDKFQTVVAAAPGIEADFYDRWLSAAVPRVANETFALLHHAHTALVTSGTATLETALFGTPQVVCYHISGGRIVNRLRPLLLKCPFISLVNLIVGTEVVPELIAADTAPPTIARHLAPLLSDSRERRRQLEGYATLTERLGEPGAPRHAAQAMVEWLEKRAAQPSATPTPNVV